MLEPYNIKIIDFKNIIIKKTKTTNNKQIFFLKYKDNKTNNFVIQLSKLINNNIISSNEIEYEINNTKLIDFLNKLDDHIINIGKNNADEWFKHLVDKSTINYQRIIQDNNTIKLKIFDNESLKTVVSLNGDLILDFNDIDVDVTQAKVILEIYAIWIKNNNFGLLVRPININITYNEAKLYDYKFLEETEENKTENNLFIKNIQFDIPSYSLTTSDDNELNINNFIMND